MRGQEDRLLTREEVRQLGLSDVRLLDNRELRLLKAQGAKSYAQALKDVGKSVEFAGKVAKVMDELRSSHVFFILQQAYSDMEWEDAQAILLNVLREQETLKPSKMPKEGEDA